MLLGDLMGDPKVSQQGSVAWDRGWCWIAPLSPGPTFILHLLGFSAKVPSVPAEMCLFG